MLIKSQYAYIGVKERMEVSRSPKTKLDPQDAIPLQVISGNSTAEGAVTAADIEASSEKRKKEAKKPLYLKRI
jgi:hypothetical protein